MAVEGVENRDREGGVGEGGCFVAKASDAGAVGGISSVEVCSSTGEGDGLIAEIADAG